MTRVLVLLCDDLGWTGDSALFSSVWPQTIPLLTNSRFPHLAKGVTMTLQALLWGSKGAVGDAVSTDLCKQGHVYSSKTLSLFSLVLELCKETMIMSIFSRSNNVSTWHRNQLPTIAQGVEMTVGFWGATIVLDTGVFVWLLGFYSFLIFFSWWCHSSPDFAYTRQALYHWATAPPRTPLQDFSSYWLPKPSS